MRRIVEFEPPVSGELIEKRVALKLIDPRKATDADNSLYKAKVLMWRFAVTGLIQAFQNTPEELLKLSSAQANTGNGRNEYFRAFELAHELITGKAPPTPKDPSKVIPITSL